MYVADNVDAWQRGVTGTWSTISGGTNTVGANYRTHAAAAAGTPEAGDTFTWKVTPLVDGAYDVFASCPVRDDTSTQAEYTVGHADGSSTATVDQNACTADTPWIKLGNYTLSAGTSENIGLKPSADGVVAADAVRLVATDEPRNRSFTYSYDANGAQTEVVDTTPGAKVDTFKTFYDGLGRTSQVQELAAETEQRVTDYSYDLNSNVVSTYARRTAGAENLAASRYTAYTWDVRNLVDTVKSGDTPAGSLDTWDYLYDPRGMLAELSKPNGNVTEVAYHEDGLPKTQIERSSAANGSKLISRHRLKFNLDGDRSEDVARLDKAGVSGSNYLDQTTRYTYTPARKLASVTKTGADKGGHESYVYDAAGNIVEQTIGSNS